MAIKTRFGLASMIAIATLTSISAAQTRPRTPVKTNAEFSLLGITLYDSGLKVIQKFGNPNEILGLATGGGGSAGPSGGGGGASGGPGGGGGPSRTGGGPPGQATPLIHRPGDIIGDPFMTGETAFRQFSPDGGDEGREGGAGAPTRPGGGGAPSLPGGGAPATVSGSDVQFTRWVYKRGTSQYGFVFNKDMRVVQIEAIGLSDARVKTRQGVTFGADFSSLVKRYGAPDGYEVGGTNLVVKFLVNRRVAFRLSRTMPNKPHRVTGIVIAAGKG